MEENRITLSFDGSLSVDNSVAFDQESFFEDFGIRLNEEGILTFSGNINLSFIMIIDLQTGEADFQVIDFDFTAAGGTGDLVLAAGYGPFEISLGKENGEKGIFQIGLSGSLSFDSAVPEFTPGSSNTLTADFPFYSSVLEDDLPADVADARRRQHM